MDKGNKPRNTKKKFYNKNRNFMEPGQRGFLATCNFREKDCIRECYQLLNEYADLLYGPGNVSKDIEETEDVEDALKQCVKAEIHNRKNTQKRFQQVSTDTQNLIFIKTTLPDPIEVGFKIISDIGDSQLQKTRFILRFLPIEEVCRANITDIVHSIEKIWDKRFLGQPQTYSIVFQKRYNNDLKRDDVIKEVAEIIATKHPLNKVDLKNAKIAIIIEVIKGLCCVSTAVDYFKYKKYNLIEICGGGDKKNNDNASQESPQKNKIVADDDVDGDDELSSPSKRAKVDNTEIKSDLIEEKSE